MPKTRLSLVLALVGLPVVAVAQSAPSVILSAPVDGYCYYAGLAYSQHALLTVDVPNRRESPQAVQKRLMRCDAGEDGSLNWVDFDLEQGKRP